ncbi:GerMN domain-containing protein [Arthrobacter sp. Y-9]|uniref:GerMN domain-containing protein n=1 Tax=Arthrobacter sp. Y-9 TaxID=3039385 RepID=UPI00241BF449|nr:GerMN domain-containing protein [Arthrobacter sp. Y-9]WFR85473.1 GerMN domain-containing protein [Arthrobacter sp. Y-9]
MSMVSTRRRRLPARLLALPLAAALLSACTATPSGTVSSGLPDPQSLATSVPEVTAAPSGTADTETQVQIYWIGRTGGNAYLFSEPRKTGAVDDPVTSALKVMMAEKPEDPDYFTAWQAPHRLAASISGASTITVDVSADAFSKNLDPSMAKRALQQLAFTAVSAARASGMVDSSVEPEVVLLIDGRNDVEAFGSIPLNLPFHRDLAFLSPVRIMVPQDEAVLSSGTLSFNGVVLGGQKNVTWSISPAGSPAGQDVISSATVALTTTAEKVGRFSARTVLPKGHYELTVSTIVPGGSQPVEDSKSVTIR